MTRFGTSIMIEKAFFKNFVAHPGPFFFKVKEGLLHKISTKLWIEMQLTFHSLYNIILSGCKE